MAYTVAQLAKISGVSVRTLHWYDEVGLLKPAYYGNQGYRYYEEEQLLLLQQILFFRELGFELKQIRRVLERGDFNQKLALTSHRQKLKKQLEKTKELIQTIDKTLQHLRGRKTMKEEELFAGFSKEKQAEYESEIIKRFGEKGKVSLRESKEKTKNWSKEDWANSKLEFDAICKQLTSFLEAGKPAISVEVQEVIHQHFEWLKTFWTPNKESYSGHGRFIAESDLRKAYAVYHTQLPEFVSEAIQIFAENAL